MNPATWRAHRDDAVARLREAGIDEPHQEVRWLVERVAGWSPAEQVTSLQAMPEDRHIELFDRLVTRRVAGEPLQYVLGSWGFRTLDLLVDRRVLIPRPETEVVAGLAVDAARTLGRSSVVVDLGTGSGAIALSLAAELWPQVEVWASDASPDALAVARANAAGLGRRATVVRLVEGSWFTALPGDLRGRVDVIVSNPPYVAADEALPDAVIRWEPREALVPGPTGLEAYEVIVAEAPQWLVPTGVLVLEIGETQADAVRALATEAGFTRVAVHPDLAGRPRAVVARH